MHTNNEIAVRNPVEEISELCWQYDAAFHCDAVQGLVRESINCSDLGASTLVFSGHKVGGPKGFGVIIRNLDDRRLKIEPLMLGGQQEGGWRPGTPNTGSIVVGTHALLDFHNNRQDYLRHLVECDNAFVQILQARCPAFELCVPLDPDSPGIVSFHIKGADADEILRALPNICMSRGAVCKNELACSHVPAALGLDQQQINGFLRASFGNGCSLEEVMTAASEISQYIRDKGRSMHLGAPKVSAPRSRQSV
jgi:cysteine desulfurase